MQVRVCAYPASRLGLQGIVISPDCNPENMPSTREVTFQPHCDPKFFSVSNQKSLTFSFCLFAASQLGN